MKILIVDDEVLVRAKLKAIISTELSPVSGEPYELCAEASNGAEALELIGEFMPDVVISDMKMPIMDGLELCEKCHSQYPQVAFVALSNFDDFEYVKGSLMNGAVDYLLKHMLDSEHIYAALTKANEKRNIKPVYKEIPEWDMNSLRRDFVVNLLAGVYDSEEQIHRNIQALKISLSPRQVIPVFMWVSDYRSTTLEERNTLSFAVINIITELMMEQGNGVVCRLEGGSYAILFSYENIKSEQKIQETLNYSLNRIRFCMKNFLELTVYFIIGNLQKSIITVEKEYKKMEHHSKNKLYVQEDMWISRQAEGDTKHASNLLYNETMSEGLFAAIINENREQAAAQIQNVFIKIADEKPSETILKVAVANILTTIESAAKRCGIQMDVVFHSTISVQEILEMNSFPRMKDALNQVLGCVLDKIEEHRSRNLSPYMQQATAYIYQKFRENLSQTEVAKILGISSTYLSVLFKNELKESFPSFLMGVRLEYAKHLLEKGKVRSREVAAESGFLDYPYFLKCFKKKYNCTPKEYIKGLQKISDRMKNDEKRNKSSE